MLFEEGVKIQLIYFLIFFIFFKKSICKKTVGEPQIINKMQDSLLRMRKKDGSVNVESIVFLQRLWLDYRFSKCVRGLLMFQERDLVRIVNEKVFHRAKATNESGHCSEVLELNDTFDFLPEISKEVHFLKIFCARIGILPRIVAVMEFRLTNKIGSDTVSMMHWADQMSRFRMFWVYMAYFTCCTKDLFFSKKNAYNAFFLTLESQLKRSAEIIYKRLLGLIDHLGIVERRKEFLDSDGTCFLEKELKHHYLNAQDQNSGNFLIENTKGNLELVLGGFHGFVQAYTFWKDKRYLSYAFATHLNVLHLCSLVHNKDMTLLNEDRQRYIFFLKEKEHQRMVQFLSKDPHGKVISFILNEKQRNYVFCGMKDLGKSAFCCAKPSRHGFVDYFNCDVFNEDYVFHQYFLSGKRFAIPENVINFGLCHRYQSHLRCLRMEIEFGLLQKQNKGLTSKKLLLQPEHLTCSKFRLRWKYFSSNPLLPGWEKALVALNTRVHYLFQEIYLSRPGPNQEFRSVTYLLKPDPRKFKRRGVQHFVQAMQKIDFTFDFQMFQTLLEKKYTNSCNKPGLFKFWCGVLRLFADIEKILDCLRKNFSAEDDFEQSKYSYQFLTKNIVYWKQWNCMQYEQNSFLKGKLRPREWTEIFLMVQIYDYWYQSIFQCEVLATNSRLKKRVILNVLNSSSAHGKVVFQSKYSIDVDLCAVDPIYFNDKMVDIPRTRLWIRKVLLFMHGSKRTVAVLKDLEGIAAFDPVVQNSSLVQNMYKKLVAFKEEWQKYTVMTVTTPFDDPFFCQILKYLFVFAATESFGFLFRESMDEIKNCFFGLNQTDFTISERTGVNVWNLMESSVSLNSWNSSIVYFPETFVLDVDFLNKVKYLNHRVVCLLTFAMKFDPMLEDVLEGQQNYHHIARYFLGIYNDYVLDGEYSSDFWYLEDSLEMIRMDIESFVSMLSKVFDLNSENTCQMTQVFVQSLDEEDWVYQMCRQELVAFWIDMLRNIETFRQLKSEQRDMIFHSKNDQKKTTFSNLRKLALSKSLLITSIDYSETVLLHLKQKIKPVLFLNFNVFRNLYQVLFPAELDLLLHWMSSSFS